MFHGVIGIKNIVNLPNGKNSSAQRSETGLDFD
jgi:hypothetical protein